MDNLQSICRICAQTYFENMKNLFSPKYNLFLQKIELITGVIFEDKNYLPQNICRQCREDLRQASSFRSRCIKSQYFFRTDEYREALEKDRQKLKRRRNRLQNGGKDNISFEYMNLEATESEGGDGGGRSSNQNNTKDTEDANKQPTKLVKNYVCHICGSNYFNINHFKTHLHKHEGYKPYQCEYCQKGFYTKSGFKIHKRIHTGVRPYPCRYCPQRLQTSGRRIEHERAHTNERPHVCKHCGKGFIRKCSLDKHLVTHITERNFSCEICNKDFKRESQLNLHLQTPFHLKREDQYQVSDDIDVM